MTINLNPLRGMRDLYPEDKQSQDYIFGKLKKIADLFGFSSYDAPLLENINIYLNKTSQDLIERQTFQVKTKDQELLIMRPEMTPSLARMVANKAGQLTFPLKLFNLGLRYRYEAPQKGREREFYQADFDILGSNSVLVDAEIINVAVTIFKTFGAKENDFVLYLNSRQEIESNLLRLGFNQKQYQQLLSIIDRRDKISKEKFEEILLTVDKDQKKIKNLITFLNQTQSTTSPYFKELFSLLEKLKINQYCRINYNTVRGLDYYTGLVFEVWPKTGEMKRALLGGGRYDNLISNFNPKNKIPGVGFATSDSVLWEFLKIKQLIPDGQPTKTKVLVTIFNQQFVDKSIEIINLLRNNNILAEISLDYEKLDKQLKYADRKGIPYVVIIGPDELKNNTLILKNMKTREQQIIDTKQIINKFSYDNKS